jgi:5-methylcytosine-specific restriction endonuclease McrA
MGFPSSPHYGLHLMSPAWRATARAALERAGYKCQVCGADRWFARLEVHHNSYANLGREPPEDLCVLCRHCHRLFHAFGKLRR